jgi:hypothetical protein
VSQLFKARQGKDEKIAEWIQRIQTLGSQFRESALLNFSDGAREGILQLSDRLRNICFVQGLASDRIQTIVRSRNYCNFDEIVETALVGVRSHRNKSGIGQKAAPYLGAAPVGKWATRVINDLLGRKDRRG